MKAQLNDIKAALLFLLVFQTREQIQGEITEEQEDKIITAHSILVEMDYCTDDEDIIYNEDGVPINISWQNPTFDYLGVIKAINYNPYFFAVQEED